MTTTTSKLLTRKELADELRRSVRFIDWMKRRGFKMPGGTATLEEARVFLAENTKPCSRKIEGSFFSL
jgi:hypothetical protein